jgi:TPR repeat protein
MDLTQPAHIQEQQRPVSSFDNSHLQVGAFASLMSPMKTLEMYRVNAKKTQEPMLQYELAVFMVQLAQQQPEATTSVSSQGRSRSSGDKSNSYSAGEAGLSRKELLKEAREILERVQSKLPQAQYYLADAYSSGLFNKGKEENEKAFPLFVAASKHGHAEAGYRAALCYEFGWGCRRDPLKAVQFFRHAASKSHPGAMTRLGIACLHSDLGLQGHYREGLKWLKRATEIADEQYPSAPYELGLLHENGYGESVLADPGYSAQLFTQAAELGHTEANFRMGDAYEHGKLSCPRDPALSVHFYTGAAQRGHALAMMALCAWYLVGAEPVLEKNEAEAYAWAVKACEYGMLPSVNCFLSRTLMDGM